MSYSNNMNTIYTDGVPPWLARFFHRFPHINITGHRVNSTFDWRSQSYLESLGILASLPTLLLIFFLLILLLYLLTRCCDRHAKRDRPLICLKALLGFLALSCCAAIGLGLYGNDDFHNGVESFVASLKNIQAYFNYVKNQTSEAQTIIGMRVYPHMLRLGVIFQKKVNETIHVELLDQMRYMESNLSHTNDGARALGISFDGPIDVSPHSAIQLIEIIRWPTTLAVLIIFIIFCVTLFYAIVRHSRCCFITFSVLGLVAVILNWTLVSVYLAGAVALSDICVNPNRAAITELTQAQISPNISDYYLNCQPFNSDVDPFRDSLIDALGSLDGARHTLRVINTLANSLYPGSDVESIVNELFKELADVETCLSETGARAECQPIHAHWKKGVERVCGTSLSGLAYLLLSALATALLFTLLVGFDSHTWIYIQRRKRYLQKEECVAFIPSTYDGHGGHPTGTGSQGRGTGRRQGAGSNSPYNLVSNWDTPTPIQPTPLHRNGTMPAGGYYRGESSMGNAGYGGSHNVQYATLSKQCKTLEANDFY